MEQCLKKIQTSQPQNGSCVRCGQLFAAQRQYLVKQGKAVAHTAGRPSRQNAQGRVFVSDIFKFENFAQMYCQGVFRKMAKYKMLATAHNCYGKFMSLSGGKNKDHP